MKINFILKPNLSVILIHCLGFQHTRLFSVLKKNITAYFQFYIHFTQYLQFCGCRIKVEFRGENKTTTKKTLLFSSSPIPSFNVKLISIKY